MNKTSLQKFYILIKWIVYTDGEMKTYEDDNKVQSTETLVGILTTEQVNNLSRSVLEESVLKNYEIRRPATSLRQVGSHWCRVHLSQI